MKQNKNRQFKAGDRAHQSRYSGEEGMSQECNQQKSCLGGGITGVKALGICHIQESARRLE